MVAQSVDQPSDRRLANLLTDWQLVHVLMLVDGSWAGLVPMIVPAPCWWPGMASFRWQAVRNPPCFLDTDGM